MGLACNRGSNAFKAAGTKCMQYRWQVPMRFYSYTAHSKTNRYVLSRSAGPRARHSRLSMAASGSCSLACLGRKSYVSQRALSQVLQQIKELPELPSATSRRTLKRARDEKTQSCKTAYGEILCDFRCVAEAGVEIAIPVLHPAAMLAWATERCPPFGEMMERAMETTPPSFLQPRGLVWYSDEIGPGNQLKHSNKRKVQCIYWSMLPLGQHAMGCEFCCSLSVPSGALLWQKSVA